MIGVVEHICSACLTIHYHCSQTNSVKHVSVLYSTAAVSWRVTENSCVSLSSTAVRKRPGRLPIRVATEI